MMNTLPRIGVGVLIIRDGKILLGKRTGSHGAGCWSAPGGHLEPGESIEQCARRETAEETGLRLGPIFRGPWSEDHFPPSPGTPGRHYLTLMVVACCPRGTPERREPEKCTGWQWFPPEALPAPLFAPLAALAGSQGLALKALIDQATTQ
ncbi:nucleotide triphosphate diphosphatase NUDT15 [Shimwellia blattae]|nr:NUDIX domain-containing protein [Shimwellia blattae]GAB80821.1 hypothetical protein EB105725_10_00080 [Shimwellia blattae DSM 4481 = NBRC 105725]VDY64550.1 Nucleoside triphosphatase nudI [Shimwellia blattae]